MSSEEKLRDEITALQAAVRDLLKWKLVLTGSVTAIGLGLTGSTTPNAYLSIGAVPLIVAYCDLLICDSNLRIGVIVTYLRIEQNNSYAGYENFLRQREIIKIRWWDLGDIATQLASYIACTFVLCVAVAHASFQTYNEELSWLLLVITSIVGIVAVAWIQRTYHRKYDALRTYRTGGTQRL